MAPAGVALDPRVGCAQVREAERQRDEERKAHDAAMTAVGTEVARLKRGQAELAITHWNLQVEFLPASH